MIPKSMPSGFDPMGGTRFSEKIMRKQTARATCDEADPIVPIRASRRKRGSGGFDRNFGRHHPDFRFSGNDRRMRSPSSNEALGNADGEQSRPSQTCLAPHLLVSDAGVS